MLRVRHPAVRGDGGRGRGSGLAVPVWGGLGLHSTTAPRAANSVAPRWPCRFRCYCVDVHKNQFARNKSNPQVIFMHPFHIVRRTTVDVTQFTLVTCEKFPADTGPDVHASRLQLADMTNSRGAYERNVHVCINMHDRWTRHSRLDYAPPIKVESPAASALEFPPQQRRDRRHRGMTGARLNEHAVQRTTPLRQQREPAEQPGRGLTAPPQVRLRSGPFTGRKVDP